MVGLPAIVARLIANQAELAVVIANPGIVDMPTQRRIASAAMQNALDFQAFVGEYMIDVTKRPGAPTPHVRCPHCLK